MEKGWELFCSEVKFNLIWCWPILSLNLVSLSLFKEHRQEEKESLAEYPFFKAILSLGPLFTTLSSHIIRKCPKLLGKLLICMPSRIEILLLLNVKSRVEVQLTQMSTNSSSLCEKEGSDWIKSLYSKSNLDERIHTRSFGASLKSSKLEALKLSALFCHLSKWFCLTPKRWLMLKERKEDRKKSCSRGKRNHHHSSALKTRKRGTPCLASQLTYQFSTQVGRKSARCQLCMRTSELDLFPLSHSACLWVCLSRKLLSSSQLRNLTCTFQSWSWMVNDFVAPFQPLFCPLLLLLPPLPPASNLHRVSLLYSGPSLQLDWLTRCARWLFEMIYRSHFHESWLAWDSSLIWLLLFGWARQLKRK